MRVIVIADTHGSFRRMKEVFLKNEDSDVFIFLGDGESDLERIKTSYPDKTILSVKGNCDYISNAPLNGVYEVDDIKIFYTHGHTWGVKYGVDRVFYKAKEIGAQVALFAHTHSRFYDYCDGVHILNPGSAALPRDGKGPSYAYIDITAKGDIFCSHVDL